MVILCLSAEKSFGQVTSLTSDTSIAIVYPSSPGTDSLFVFYSAENSLKTGSLTAIPVASGLYSFSWSRYNPVAGNFNPPFYDQVNVTQSTVSNLESGGYRVRFQNADNDITVTAWVLTDTLRVNVLKDSNGKVMSSKYTCDFITVNGLIDSTRFSYYDPLTNSPVSVPAGYTFLWTSDNEDLIIPWPDTSLVSNRSFNPPYVDTWYYLTATDKLGNRVKDSVLYESIVVKPLFSFLVYDKVESKDFIEPSKPVEGGAPLKVKFTNESLNGANFEWIYSDRLRSGFFANEITQNPDYQPEFSYNIPGDYYPAIIVTSEEGCVDSFRLPEPITVRPSKLEVMNVFSPDGDSFNDYFKVSHESIREFTIRIFNRSGKAVYKADINDLYEWEGWDGNVLNTDKPASPGAYYYVIEATGWDKEEYHRGTYAGVVYLYRE